MTRNQRIRRHSNAVRMIFVALLIYVAFSIAARTVMPLLTELHSVPQRIIKQIGERK